MSQEIEIHFESKRDLRPEAFEPPREAPRLDRIAGREAGDCAAGGTGGGQKSSNWSEASRKTWIRNCRRASNSWRRGRAVAGASFFFSRKRSKDRLRTSAS